MSKLLNGIINYIGANGIFKNNDGDIPITSGNIILDNGRKLMSKNSQNVAKNIVGYNTDKVVFNYNGVGGTDVNAELFGNSITASAGGGVNISNTSNGTTDIILQSNARFTSTIGADTTTNSKITLSSDDGNVDIYTYRKITRNGTTQTHENTYTFTSTGQLQGIQTPSSDTNAANKKYVDDKTVSFGESQSLSIASAITSTSGWTATGTGFLTAYGTKDHATDISSYELRKTDGLILGVCVSPANADNTHLSLTIPIKQGTAYRMIKSNATTVYYYFTPIEIV